MGSDIGEEAADAYRVAIVVPLGKLLIRLLPTVGPRRMLGVRDAGGAGPAGASFPFAVGPKVRRAFRQP